MMGKVAEVLGLTALESASLALTHREAGAMASFDLRVPQASRRGLTQLLSLEAKDGEPPAFVPADVLSFYRTRLDLRKVWNTIESTLVAINPQWSGMFNLIIDNVGKAEDANFDLRQNLIANLGDDIVTYSKESRGRTLEDLDQQPSMVLISSAKPEELANAIRALAALMPGQQGAKVSEREFLGRTLYSVNLPSTGGSGLSKLTFVANAGYVALSTDAALVEEYLRGNPSQSLRETSGWNAAAQEVGGTRLGMFGYENDRATVGFVLEILKKESGKLSNLFNASPLANRVGSDGAETRLDDWFDFSLLPAFEQIKKYFDISVYGGGIGADGFSFKAYTPNPPGL
jgi:hypothetical protein